MGNLFFHIFFSFDFGIDVLVKIAMKLSGTNSFAFADSKSTAQNYQYKQLQGKKCSLIIYFFTLKCKVAMKIPFLGITSGVFFGCFSLSGLKDFACKSC